MLTPTPMKKLLTFLVVTLLATTAWAYVDQQIGIGIPYWSVQMGTGTTASCVTNVGTVGGSATATNACALFPAGQNPRHNDKVAVITGDAAARCAWTTDINAAFDGTDVNEISGGNPSAGALIPLNGEWHTRPNYLLHAAANAHGGGGGHVTGICSTAISSAGDPDLYLPCNVDADCDDTSDSSGGSYDAGTCTAAASVTQTQLRNVGMILICDIGDVTVRKEQISRNQ